MIFINLAYRKERFCNNGLDEVNASQILRSLFTVLSWSFKARLIYIPWMREYIAILDDIVSAMGSWETDRRTTSEI